MPILISYLLWPGLMALAYGLTWLGLLLGFQTQAVLTVVYLVHVGILLVLERMAPFEHEWLESDGQVVNDLTHTILSNVIVRGIGEAVIRIVLTVPAAWLASQSSMALWPHSWPIALQAVFGVVLAEFGFYWAHRLSHKLPILWRFHALHHSPPKVHVINTGRFHPVNTLLSAGMGLPILILLGAPEPVFIWLAATFNYIGALSHANIDMRFGFLNYIFNTPGVHFWHHAKNPAIGDHNYGDNLMIWDVVFRTHYNPERRPDTVVGIRTYMPEGILAQLAAPFNWKKLERRTRETAAAMEAAAPGGRMRSGESGPDYDEWLETELLKGLEGPDAELTDAEWDSIEREALETVKQRIGKRPESV